MDYFNCNYMPSRSQAFQQTKSRNCRLYRYKQIFKHLRFFPCRLLCICTCCFLYREVRFESCCRLNRLCNCTFRARACRIKRFKEICKRSLQITCRSCCSQHLCCLYEHRSFRLFTKNT